MPERRTRHDLVRNIFSIAALTETWRAPPTVTNEFTSLASRSVCIFRKSYPGGDSPINKVDPIFRSYNCRVELNLFLSGAEYIDLDQARKAPFAARQRAKSAPIAADRGECTLEDPAVRQDRGAERRISPNSIFAGPPGSVVIGRLPISDVYENSVRIGAKASSTGHRRRRARASNIHKSSECCGL